LTAKNASTEAQVAKLNKDLAELREATAAGASQAAALDKIKKSIEGQLDELREQLEVRREKEKARESGVSF